MNLFLLKRKKQTKKQSNTSILIDLTTLRHPNCGLGQFALNFGKHLSLQVPDDLKLTLYVPKQFNGYFGNNVTYLNYRKTYRRFPFLLPKFDIWHSTYQLSRNTPPPTAKVILTLHDLNVLYEKERIKALHYLSKIQKEVDRADVITTVSHFSAGEISNHLKGNKKPTVIYCGVEQLENKQMEAPDFIQHKHKPFLFTIGEVKAKKNFHVLLDAMKLMPEYDLYISGNLNSSYANMLQDRITKEKIENVFLTDIIEDQYRIWMYAHCTAFVFPSKFEGFGLPIIEAMQFNKPVCSSQMTSLKEIGGNMAYFFENFEPEHIKDTVTRAIYDYQQHPELAAKAKQYALQFSHESNVKEYINLYRSMRNNLSAE